MNSSKDSYCTNKNNIKNNLRKSKNIFPENIIISEEERKREMNDWVLSTIDIDWADD